MPHGARTTLAALVLLLGIGSAAAEPGPGTTWTDPPARQPAAAAPATDRKAADRKVAAPTPAAATPSAAETRPLSIARKAEARSARARPAAQRGAGRRRVAASRKARIAKAPTRPIREPQVVVAAPPLPPEGYARYRPYGYGPGYGPGYADERLDRLSSAEAAGYVVVRRRTVLFPDGRALRVYRPDDGEPF